MYGAIKQHLAAELKSIEEAGLFKKERIITTPQDALIKLADGSEVLNFCSNNYLGLSSHPRVVDAAKRAIDTHGFGLSSVRFICGTQNIHKELEAKIAEFYGTEDTILYAAAFDANGGVFYSHNMHILTSLSRGACLEFGFWVCPFAGRVEQLRGFNFFDCCCTWA